MAEYQPLHVIRALEHSSHFALQTHLHLTLPTPAPAITGDSRELLLSQISPPTMSGPEVHHLFHNPIADHSFSADRQTLAVARDNNVELYQNPDPNLSSKMNSRAMTRP